jgi:hypothetical protein
MSCSSAADVRLVTLAATNQTMSGRQSHDTAALIRHARAAGDLRLVELISRVLTDQTTCSSAARRVYGSLVRTLGLDGQAADNDR